MENGGQARRRLDSRRLKRTGIGDKLLLIVSAEAGLVIGVLGGGFALMPTVYNHGLMDIQMYGIAMAASLMLGCIVVPAFGFIFGLIGAAGARDRAIRDNKVQLLAIDHPVTRVVHSLAREMGLDRMPLVGIYPDVSINAFAAGSGRRDAIVCFTEGLLQRCSSRELLAVAAHEVAHVANNDMHRLQLACSFQNALTWYLLFERLRAFVRWLLSTMGELLILRLSRSREYWADATAAAVLGKEVMIEALRRLEEDEVRPSVSKLAYARLMIRPYDDEIFSTHPPLKKRIAALEKEQFIRKLPFLR